MKKNIVLMVIVLGFVSCRPEPEDLKIKYTIINNATHNVKLLVYYRQTNMVGNVDSNSIYIDTNIVFLLPKNEELKMIYTNVHVDSPFGLLNDSAFIVFGNIKQLIYRWDDGQARNILDVNSYMGGKVNDYLYQYKYEITDVDYANALEFK